MILDPASLRYAGTSFGFWILDLKRKKSSLRLRRSPWFAFAALRPCGMRCADLECRYERPGHCGRACVARRSIQARFMCGS
jgi:hypothetical protein